MKSYKFQLPCRVTLVAFSMLFILTSQAFALDVKGKGDIPYNTALFSSTPDAKSRQEAIRAAKVSAWKNYVSTFSAPQMKLYKQIEKQITSNIDAYIVDYTVLDEAVDKDAQLFSVVIRANINEAALDNKLRANSAAGSQGSGHGSKFSFIFTTRQTASIKSFDARHTHVQSEDKEESATHEASAKDGNAAISEASKNMSESSEGGSTLQKADELKYNANSAGDIDTAMSEVIGNAGFDVASYPDVVGACGGPLPKAIAEEFAQNDELSPQLRKSAIDAARQCEITIFAIGNMDVGVSDIDPVSGNHRVYVSVRGQVWDITGKLPRKIASVGPIQYAGLGPDSEVARRNALILAGKKGAKAIVDQLNAKGVH